MSAFTDAFEYEMRGAIEDCWYDWLRATSPVAQAADKEALRARARQLTDMGERPPVPSYDEYG